MKDRKHSLSSNVKSACENENERKKWFLYDTFHLTQDKNQLNLTATQPSYKVIFWVTPYIKVLYT